MAIQELVTAYTVTTLRSDLVDYRRVIRLTTETGHQAFLAFPPQPPADWLTVSGPTSTAYLERDEFDRVYHVLQSEAPVFYTALNLFGIGIVGEYVGRIFIEAKQRPLFLRRSIVRDGEIRDAFDGDTSIRGDANLESGDRAR